MLDMMSRATFSALAGSVLLKKLASRYGMRHPHSFARRFVAGETLEEAIAAAVALEHQGLSVTVDLLGESVDSADPAMAATQAYISVIRAAAAAGISRNLSVKLTQIGLDIDRATSTDNLRRIVEVAAEMDFFVRIDMEGSAYTERTLSIAEALHARVPGLVGTVIQAYLHRSDRDLERLIDLQMRVRLVKGAYAEPASLALQRPSEINEAFIRLMERLLEAGRYPAIASHDPALIRATRGFALRMAIDPGRWEFQMLYGVRRDAQLALSREGYGMRIYLPFGVDWYPYFARRIAERPANMLFVLRQLMTR